MRNGEDGLNHGLADGLANDPDISISGPRLAEEEHVSDSPSVMAIYGSGHIDTSNIIACLQYFTSRPAHGQLSTPTNSMRHRHFIQPSLSGQKASQIYQHS